MFLDSGASYGFESSIADMQRDFCQTCVFTYFEEHLRGKMQTGSGSRNCSGLSRKNSLISFSVFCQSSGGSLNVGRQWHQTDLIQEVFKRALTMESNPPQIFTGIVQHLS